MILTLHSPAFQSYHIQSIMPGIATRYGLAVRGSNPGPASAPHLCLHGMLWVTIILRIKKNLMCTPYSASEGYLHNSGISSVELYDTRNTSNSVIGNRGENVLNSGTLHSNLKWITEETAI